MKTIVDIIDDAIRTKRFIGGLGRLKRDGSIVKINGQVFQRKVTRKGDTVLLIDNFLGKPRAGQTKRWQLVLLNNMLKISENGWQHTRAA